MPRHSAIEIVTIPCLADNYAFLIHDAESGATALVDAPEAAPIMAELERRSWQLGEIWLTHHHWDHVDAVPDLREATGARVLGAAADAHRLPPLSGTLEAGRAFDFAGHEVRVIDVPGHTIGHVAFYLPDAAAAFTADSLMALGCGRLFEGTPEQMWASLGRLAALPEETMIHSGHEYSAANARFALTIEPGNARLAERARQIESARAEGRPTVPTSLALEKATNPFLRADQPEIRRATGLEQASDAEVFAHLRKLKDAF